MLPPPLTDVLARLRALWNLPRRIDHLQEIFMAAIDDLVTRLAAATDDIANELKNLRDEVAGSDTAAAEKFEPLIARLEAMGSDSNDPVPSDGGDTPEPSPEPTPDDGDQPTA